MPRPSRASSRNSTPPAAINVENFAGAMPALAEELPAPVDAFFDKVIVNADDAVLRANRLGAAVGDPRGDAQRGGISPRSWVHSLPTYFMGRGSG